jgi:hypothetical protein
LLTVHRVSRPAAAALLQSLPPGAFRGASSFGGGDVGGGGGGGRGDEGGAAGSAGAAAAEDAGWKGALAMLADASQDGAGVWPGRQRTRASASERVIDNPDSANSSADGAAAQMLLNQPLTATQPAVLGQGTAGATAPAQGPFPRPPDKLRAVTPVVVFAPDAAPGFAGGGCRHNDHHHDTFGFVGTIRASLFGGEEVEPGALTEDELEGLDAQLAAAQVRGNTGVSPLCSRAARL